MKELEYIAAYLRDFIRKSNIVEDATPEIILSFPSENALHAFRQAMTRDVFDNQMQYKYGGLVSRNTFKLGGVTFKLRER